MDLLLLIILVLILVGGVPAYRGGALPLNSLLSFILILVVVLLLFGLLAPYPHRWWPY